MFPITWGQAEVSPVPKTSDLSKVENWRPISQMKLPGKILLHTQLSKFAEEFLDKNQHGFRSTKSTSTDIFDVMQNLSKIGMKIDTSAVYSLIIQEL